MLNVTADELRRLARGEVDESVRAKAARLVEPAPPAVIPGQTTIDDHLEVARDAA